MTPYIPHTQSDVQAMLQRVGLSSLKELYADVPAEFMREEAPDLPDAMSEQEIRVFFQNLADRNPRETVFVGAGAYDHYTPSVIPYITSRSEFLTAYTPYQCEISQGTLRYIFEYQSMICALTGLDVSNASLYDGPTAAAEAMMMVSASAKGKGRVLLSATLPAHVLKVVETYARFHGVAVDKVPALDGQTSADALRSEIAKADVAGLIAPSVNRYGIVEDHSGFADILHGAKALLVEYCDPSALAVLKSPAEYGADIAVGDGQPLGIPLSYGGPYIGFMAVRKEHMRKMPGRIVGQTVDKDGKRSYVLTLQAREQHIRREKATSNICSNQSLMALWVTVYLSLMGPEGLSEVNRISYDGAHFLKSQLIASGRFKDPFPEKPFLKEFVLEPSGESAAQLHQRLLAKGFLAALPTEEGFVSFCVTEKRTPEEVAALVKAIVEG